MGSVLTICVPVGNDNGKDKEKLLREEKEELLTTTGYSIHIYPLPKIYTI